MYTKQLFLATLALASCLVQGFLPSSVIRGTPQVLPFHGTDLKLGKIAAGSKAKVSMASAQTPDNNSADIKTLQDKIADLEAEKYRIKNENEIKTKIALEDQKRKLTADQNAAIRAIEDAYAERIDKVAADLESKFIDRLKSSKSAN